MTVLRTRLRILHTVEFYHPHVGGAEKVVQNVSERLVARGHNVTVATSLLPNTTQREVVNGVEVRRFDIRGNLVKGMKGETQAYIDFVRDSRFDLIMNYAAQAWPTDLLFPHVGRLNTVMVLFPCGYSGLRGWRKPLYWNYFRQLPDVLRRYDRIVYHSPGYIDKRFGDRHGINHFSIIPNAVDSSEFLERRSSARAPLKIQEKQIVLTVSNHFKIKGHSRFFDAADALASEDVAFLLVGNRPPSRGGGCWRACNRAASKNPHVYIGADLDREQVVAAFQESTCFVLPSFTEVFPLVVLEAMAAGVPIVSFDVGNVTELAGTITVRKPRDFVAQVKRVLEDDELRRQLGGDGRRAQRLLFDWANVVGQYEQLYWSLVQGRGN